MVHEVCPDFLGRLKWREIPHLRPSILPISLLAALTLPLLANHPGDGGNGNKLRKSAVNNAGTAPAAKMICQVWAP